MINEPNLTKYIVPNWTQFNILPLLL